jgi:hypothetical protein
VSISDSDVIWRIIEAVSHHIDGPIHLNTSDAVWLHEYLLRIVTEPAPRKGKPRQSNHYLWVGIDVALRRLAEPNKPWKVAYSDVAESWRVTIDKVEEWEPKVRDVANQIVSNTKIDRFEALVLLVKRNRHNYLEKVNLISPG